MPITDHSSKQYDLDLADIKGRVLQMGGLVETQVRAAIEAFCAGDDDRIATVESEDYRVNAFEVTIDDACAHIIARRQPAAGDLRMIMGISKIVTDLERCGDEAAKIARMARRIYQRERVRIPRLADLSEIGDLALRQLHQALDAFVRLDATAAAAIVREDKELDEKFESLLRQLITFMMEDPRTISTALDMTFIAKAVERIGDHAKNLAEQVIYIVRGTDVRHIALEQLERKASGEGETP
jgi:phosphate transport system protein